MGESRLLPGGPSSSEGSSTRTNTPYLPNLTNFKSNRGLYFCKVSHPLEVRVRQRLLPDNSVGRSQTNQQRMESLVKRHKKCQQSTKIWLNNTRNVLKAMKAVEVLPLLDTLIKHYRLLWMCITFILFRVVRTWFLVINLTYSSPLGYRTAGRLACIPAM